VSGAAHAAAVTLAYVYVNVPGRKPSVNPGWLKARLDARL
jgi:hypothetical protein